jgi:hypothetical protein
LGSFVNNRFLVFYEKRQNHRNVERDLDPNASGSLRTHYDERDVADALAFVVTGPIPDRFDSTYHALQVFENVGFPILARHLAVLNWFRTYVESMDDSGGKIFTSVSHPIDLVNEKIRELLAFVDAFDRRLRLLIDQPNSAAVLDHLEHIRKHVPQESGLMTTINHIISLGSIESVDVDIGCSTWSLHVPCLDTVVVNNSEKIIPVVTDNDDADDDGLTFTNRNVIYDNVSVQKSDDATIDPITGIIQFLCGEVDAHYFSKNAIANGDGDIKNGMSSRDHFLDLFKRSTVGVSIKDKMNVAHNFTSRMHIYDPMCASFVRNAVYQSCIRDFLDLCNHSNLSDDEIAIIGETLFDDDCATHSDNATFVSVLADALYEADLLSDDRIRNYKNVEFGFLETNVVSANKKRMQPTNRGSGKAGKHGVARAMRFRDTRVANKPDKDEVVGSGKLTKKPESSEYHKKKVEAKAMRVAKANARMSNEEALKKIAREAKPTTPVKFEVDDKTAKFSSHQFSRFKNKLKTRSEASANQPNMYNVVYENGTTGVVSESDLEFYSDIIVSSELANQVINIDDGSSYGYVVTCDKNGDWWTLFETKNGYHRWSKITRQELSNLCDGHYPADIRVNKYLLVFRSAVGTWIIRHAQNNRNSKFMTVFNRYIELSSDKIYPAGKYTITIFGESVNAWRFTHKKA